MRVEVDYQQPIHFHTRFSRVGHRGSRLRRTENTSRFATSDSSDVPHEEENKFGN